MSPPPTQLALTGGDHFLYALDTRMRRMGLTGNVCRVALQFESRLDGERLRRVLDDSPMIAWLTGARLVRRWPPLTPLWRSRPRSACLLSECSDPEVDTVSLHDLLEASAGSEHLRPTQGPLLGLRLVHRRDAGSSLILSWQHALLDVRGLELLLRGLDPVPPRQPATDSRDWFSADQTARSSARLWREGLRKARAAQGSLRYTTEVCREPVFSFLDGCSMRGNQRQRCRLLRLTEEQTSRVDLRREQLGGSLGPSLYCLAASLQAVHQVVRRRGGAPAAYVVPVPHDLRRNGAPGPVFSNQLTFLFYRIEPQLARDMGPMIETLTEQMVDQIRHKIPDSFLAAMDISKPIPVGLYLKWLGRPSRGKFASFFFSYAGEAFRDLRQFLGVPVNSIDHYAPATLPPGLTLVFSRFRSRLSVTLAWVEGCLSEDEAVELEQGLLRSLLGDARP